MKERVVKFVVSDRGPVVECEAPLWAFIFAQPYLSATNFGILPPLHLLNTVLKAGALASSRWEPFELSAEEYAALVPKMLQPNRVELAKYTQHIWQSFERDEALDNITDYGLWQQRVREKHMQSWAMRMARMQHEMVMAAHNKG